VTSGFPAAVERRREHGQRFAQRTLQFLAVQVIWGEQDRYLVREIAEPSREWVPDLRFAPIPEASHWVQADAPERVNRLLIDFFRA